MKTNYLTAREVAELYGWPLGGIKQQLFNREENGLSKAVLKIGRKLLIDKAAFELWLEEHREVPLNSTEANN